MPSYTRRGARRSELRRRRLEVDQPDLGLVVDFPRASQEERERYLRWLRAGAEMAGAIWGKQARHWHVIWVLLVDAVDLIDRIDDPETRWLTKGLRAQSWDMLTTRAEAFRIEIARLMSAMKPSDAPLRYKPQASDHERMLDVMSWIRWSNVARDASALQDAAIELARGRNVDAVVALYRPSERHSRKIFYEIKKRICDHIIRGLREQCGIVPGNGLTFVEMKP